MRRKPSIGMFFFALVFVAADLMILRHLTYRPFFDKAMNIHSNGGHLSPNNMFVSNPRFGGHIAGLTHRLVEKKNANRKEDDDDSQKNLPRDDDTDLKDELANGKPSKDDDGSHNEPPEDDDPDPKDADDDADPGVQAKDNVIDIDAKDEVAKDDDPSDDKVDIISEPTPEQKKLMQVAIDQGLVRVDDKGQLLEILTQAGYDLEDGDLDQETLDGLPTWTQVLRLYGSEPKIYGLEKCEDFRNSVEPTTRFFGMSGTFNTGTNLIADLMRFNCQITERMEFAGHESKGVRWQVPWGKHYMARYRTSGHTTKTDKDVPIEHILPLVTIRDPYFWMQSMCRHRYTAMWPHTKAHCPNLIPTKAEIHRLPMLRQLYGGHDGNEHVEQLVPVDVHYSKDLIHHHLSFPHWYSEWYNDYYKANYPRIMVRFEDLLFHGEEVTRKMCECGGGVPRPDNGRSGLFTHVSESSKKGKTAHGDPKERTNLVGALMKYGTSNHRADSMTAEDLDAARRHLDPELMKAFAYSHPPMPR